MVVKQLLAALAFSLDLSLTCEHADNSAVSDAFLVRVWTEMAACSS